jgi:hypothetical protein
VSRLLAPPVPASIGLDPEGNPSRISRPLVGALDAVARWKVDLDWWLQPVRRDYWRVLYEGRLLCDLFWDHDLASWFLERIYD